MSVTDDLNEFRDATQLAQLRETAANLSRQLAEAKNRSAKLADAVYQAAYEAMVLAGMDRANPPKPDKRTHGEEVALWHLTDWQGSKVTTTYNTEVMKARVMQFCQKAATITEIQRSDHPIKRCVIMLGGDMVEGLFNFPT